MILLSVLCLVACTAAQSLVPATPQLHQQTPVVIPISDQLYLSQGHNIELSSLPVTGSRDQFRENNEYYQPAGGHDESYATEDPYNFEGGSYDPNLEIKSGHNEEVGPVKPGENQQKPPPISFPSIPRPPFISNFISSLPPLSNYFPTFNFPNINFPFQIPTIFSRPRLIYYNYPYVVQAPAIVSSK